MKKSMNLFNISERDQKKVLAGSPVVCMCGCVWANCGGSSGVDNSMANADQNVDSPGYLPRC